MNIAAVMAALDVWDLDATAKHALVVVACRADRVSGAAGVPIRRVAADMHCHYNTAQRALVRLVAAGYLTVDKVPGSASKWRLNPHLHARPTPTTSGEGGLTSGLVDPHTSRGEVSPLEVNHKDSLEKFKEERAAAAARHPTSGGAGDNPSPRVPPHPPSDPEVDNGSEPARPDFAGARDRLLQLAADRPVRRRK